MTKTFENSAAQGDVLLTRIDALPDDVRLAPVEADGVHIVTHSETGHHHVVEAKKVEMFVSDNPWVSYLKVLANDAALEHRRSFDTHAPLALRQGAIYEVRRQREYTPEGFRRAQD